MATANDELTDDVERRLSAWALASLDESATISNVRSLGGHSGITIGFNLSAEDRASAAYVLKILPQGVRPKSNFDLLRQVPLLKALRGHGIPAPAPVWWSAETEWFASPYLITERLSGEVFPDLFVAKEASLPNARSIFFDAVDKLADIHSLDATRILKDWSAPRLLSEEVQHWIVVLNKSTDQSWIEAGSRLAEKLLGSAPESCHVGIVHGDFYSNNWLNGGDYVAGIVDWEGASLGPSLLDLGWLCMIYDPDSWVPGRTGISWCPPAAELIARYRTRSGVDTSRISWYRALAAYRLACLTAYYFELHRSGKRQNTAWNVFARSFQRMIERAQDLLNAE